MKAIDIGVQPLAENSVLQHSEQSGFSLKITGTRTSTSL